MMATWAEFWADVARSGFWDPYTGWMAFISGSSLAIRANMLKPDLKAWVSAPNAVWLSLWALSLAYGMAACNLLLLDGKSGWMLILICTASAISSVIMLGNLMYQAWQPDLGLDGEGERC